ncbi:MAG: hypothetical protein KUL75_08250 [Sterolibacterium sp.]|nr:hypothetical protein [Sterolibacterium sp.]
MEPSATPRDLPAVPPALTLAWLALVLLTLLSLGIGRWFHGQYWLPLMVAGILGFKGWLVGRYFIEAHVATPFIRFVLWTFVACTPLALVLTVFYGAEFAAWTRLWLPD